MPSSTDSIYYNQRRLITKWTEVYRRWVNRNYEGSVRSHVRDKWVEEYYLKISKLPYKELTKLNRNTYRKEVLKGTKIPY